jgi:eukaryotic-like serine/threonine-protein kinase
MPFVPGTTIGSYRLLALLGAGGMGEVYRAKDTTLGREVALKVLREALVSDRDWHTRFEREARVLASLNHPNIAMLLGFRQLDQRSVIEMELVPGETLALRLAMGPLPIAQALPIMQQIAQALEAAHERGVIHRDLKPANIKITPEGRVKVLDFGVAKVLVDKPKLDDISHTPTVSLSHKDVVLGTPRYMSPEQLRGQPVDRRADIWSFGCIFYQVLCGRPPFADEAETDMVAAILRDDPDWEAIAHVPTGVQRLVRRCMRKDTQLRLRDIADARIEIEEFLSETHPRSFVSGPVVRRWSPRTSLTGVAIAAGLALAAIGGWWMARRPVAVRPELARVAIPLNPGQHLVTGASMPFAVSADGHRLAYVAAGAGVPAQIFVRDLDRFEAVPVAGTKGATTPFFSPDGQWIGFYAGDALQRVTLSGGAPLVIANAPPVAGATWASDDTILYATTVPGDGLWRVAAAGGLPEALTKPDTSKGELRHTHPRLLPGGAAALFTALTGDGAYAGILTLGTRASRLLPQTRATGGGVQFVAPDRLVYAHAGGLVATGFDPAAGEVRGGPQPLVERAETADDGTAWFEATSPALVYVPGRSAVPQRTLMLVDRDGRATPFTDVRGAYAHPRFSPDGRWVAVTIETESGSDIWLFDIQRGTRTRFTSLGATRFPTWTPDARSIAFQSIRTAAWTLFRQRVDDSGPAQPLLTGSPASHADVMAQMSARLLPGSPPMLTGANPQAPESWSVSGALAFTERRPSGERDIWVLEPDSSAAPFLMSPFDESAPAFSPNGRLLAYVSDESGRPEVYVQPYPGPGQKWLISTGGGSDPVWSADGRQLFYRDGTRMMAASIDLTPAVAAGTARPLFDGAFDVSDLDRNFDVSPDGRRFLMVRSEAAGALPQFRVVFNWISVREGQR